MNFKLLLVVFCLFAFCSIAFAQAQEPPQDKMMLVEGLVETFAGCPVVLSEPKYSRPRVITPQDGMVKVHEEVRIENISGKAIKKMIVAFRYDGPNGGMMRLDKATKPIGIGEVLVSKYTYQIGSGDKTDEGYNGVFTALAIAVEFEDDTHWVKPYTADDQLIMMAQALNRQPSPLVVQRCDNIDESYRATLLTRSDGVVAYRLGVVKDLPGSFEVRLGEWMAMPETATPPNVEVKISAADPKVSLPQSWLFKREKVRRNGFRGSPLVGVSLFVAEVKLADGTVWKQNLTRDELMWGRHNQ
ncbi:MAG: hypothetical protein AB7P14_14295 [Blastocatellales bacterium]